MSDRNLLCHIKRYKGETVTIFTTSGGASGCGFTGVILEINCDFLRLTTHIGSAPANPLSESICGKNGGCGDPPSSRYSSGEGFGSGCGHDGNGNHSVGSVVDIPLNRIVAFCHNAV